MAALSALLTIVFLALSTAAIYSDTGVYIATDTSVRENANNSTTHNSGSDDSYMIGDTIVVVREGSSYREFDSDGLLTQVDVALAPQQSDRATVVMLSDGRNATLMVKPLDASLKAQGELGVNDCKGYCMLKLREQRVQGHSRAVYHVTVQKKARVLGVIPAHLQTTTDIDAESGQVIDTHKSWWSFMARSDTQAEAYSNSGTSLSSTSGTSASTTGSASGY